MTPGRVAAFAAGAATLSALAAGCASERDRAREHALDRLREQAEELRGYGADVLSSRAGEEALAALRRDRPAVYAGAVRDGTVTWDAAFTAKGSAGGGLTFEDVALRTCVTYEGRPGGAVTWRPAECPASIEGDRRFGPYDETVRVEPE